MGRIRATGVTRPLRSSTRRAALTPTSSKCAAWVGCGVVVPVATRAAARAGPSPRGPGRRAGRRRCPRRGRRSAGWPRRRDRRPRGSSTCGACRAAAPPGRCSRTWCRAASAPPGRRGTSCAGARPRRCRPRPPRRCCCAASRRPAGRWRRRSTRRRAAAAVAYVAIAEREAVVHRRGVGEHQPLALVAVERERRAPVGEVEAAAAPGAAA